MKKRRLDDLLESYAKYCENSESPKNYHTWGALSTIASCLQRKVSMRWGHSEIYANLYICLIGPSGIRKAEPVVIARDFISEIGSIQHVAESITKEALIKRMKGALQPYDYPGAGALELRNQCAVSVIAEEFAVFLGDSDTRFLADLTNWYDARDKWTYETKHQGIDTITGVCLNILASMAPDWIPTAIPMGAIGGGFTSRIIFIVEHKKAKTIPNPNLTGVNLQLREDIINDLQIVNDLTGMYEFSPDALECYMDWYSKEEKKTASGHPAITDPRFSGDVSRRATHVKKLSMVIAAARSNKLIIEQADFQRSLHLLQHAERSMPEVFGRVGLSIYAETTAIIMEYIKRRKHISKGDVLRELHRDVDERTLSIIEATLEISGFIRVDHVADDPRKKTYHWVG